MTIEELKAIRAAHIIYNKHEFVDGICKQCGYIKEKKKTEFIPPVFYELDGKGKIFFIIDRIHKNKGPDYVIWKMVESLDDECIINNLELIRNNIDSVRFFMKNEKIRRAYDCFIINKLKKKN